jgi:hypothetical protein
MGNLKWGDTMSSLARYFVFQRDGYWMVTLDGVRIARHASQAEALHSAIVMADLMGVMRHDADVLVENDGRLEVAWTYGLDQVPQMSERAA